MKGPGKKHVKSKISNFLILMSFGSAMCVLHDAKIKHGKKLLVPMLWAIKENKIHGDKLNL